MEEYDYQDIKRSFLHFFLGLRFCESLFHIYIYIFFLPKGEGITNSVSVESQAKGVSDLTVYKISAVIEEQSHF